MSHRGRSSTTAILESELQAFARGDLDAVVEHFTENCVLTVMIDGLPVHGRNAARDYLKELLEIMPTSAVRMTSTVHNLEWDPREEHEVGFPHIWVAHPMAPAGAFLKTLALEPPIKPGTPGAYTPPKPGKPRPQERVEIGPIIQFVTSLVKTAAGDRAGPRGIAPEHGLQHSTG